MAENLNVLENVLEHYLFGLRFYQFENFLSWHQRDI